MLAHEGEGLVMGGEGAKVESQAVDGVCLHFFPFVGTRLARGSDSQTVTLPAVVIQWMWVALSPATLPSM
jgi:hypothetical protein